MIEYSPETLRLTDRATKQPTDRCGMHLRFHGHPGMELCRYNRDGLISLPTVGFLLIAGLVFVGACSRPEPRPDPDERAAADEARDRASEGEKAAQTSSPRTASESRQSCLGKVVPPRGAGGAQYLQQPAITRTGDIEAVVERAREQLLDRLCQGYRCQTLAPQIQTWEIHRSGPYRCSKAVIEKAEYEAWLDETETKLERELQTMARKFVETVGGPDGSPKLAIAPVEDHRAVGGSRAHWLFDKMQSALTEAGATLVEYDASETETAAAFDGTVRGSIYTRETFEKLLEVTWRIAAAGEIRAADSVTFPEALSPEVDPETYLPQLPEGDGSVEIHFDYLAGGGFCNGQRFELWLQTDQKLHVRVVNLSGESGQLIYPMAGQSSTLEPGDPVSLGEFRAIRTDSPPVERWIVIAAPTREGLGTFASLEAVCRLPSSVASDLQRGRGLPDAARERFAAQSFRIMRDTEQCESYEVSERTVERTARALEQTPKCWSEAPSEESDKE